MAPCFFVGIHWSDAQPRFTRSKLHSILLDRAYIGEVRYKNQWFPGVHEPLVDRATFERVQARLGIKTYSTHESVYGSGLIECGHCGRPIVVEIKTKMTKKGTSEYRYYRCARYTENGHPRTRVPERFLDEQVSRVVCSLKLSDHTLVAWFANVLKAKNLDIANAERRQSESLERQRAVVVKQKDQLLNMRLANEIDADTFAQKQFELRNRESEIMGAIASCGGDASQDVDSTIELFELSRMLEQKWVNADTSTKRQLLDILCLNLTLDDVNLCLEMRKPFDLIAKGLVPEKHRGDRPCTFVNEISGLGLVRSLFPQVIEFTGDMILQFVEPGLYSKRK